MIEESSTDATTASEEKEQEAASVQIARIEQETEKMKLNHPRLGVYNEEGRKIELEPDYRVDASTHKALSSYLKLLEAEFDSSTDGPTCLIFSILMISSIGLGIYSNSLAGFLLSVLVGFALAAASYMTYEKFAFNRKLDTVVDYLLANDLKVEDFVVIAEKSLSEKSKIRSYIVKIAARYASVAKSKES